MIRLISARNTGLVFHFEDSPKSIISIYRSGWEHTHPERVIEEMPKRKAQRYQTKGKDGRPTNTTPSFLSVTQSPSSMIQFHSDSWRYGMILDNRILSDNNYSTPYPYEFTLDNVEHHDGLDFIEYEYDSETNRWVMSGGLLRDITLSDSQIDRLGDIDENEWGGKLRIVRQGPVSYRLYYNFSDKAYTEEATFYEKIENKYQKVKKNIIVQPSKISELPGILFELLKASGHQSEQRYYEKPGQNLQIRKALKGLLIPDVEYFSQVVRYCAKQCNIPEFNIYIYRDWKYDKNSKRYKDLLARAEKEEVALDELYKIPTYL